MTLSTLLISVMCVGTIVCRMSLTHTIRPINLDQFVKNLSVFSESGRETVTEVLFVCVCRSKKRTARRRKRVRRAAHEEQLGVLI